MQEKANKDKIVNRYTKVIKLSMYFKCFCFRDSKFILPIRLHLRKFTCQRRLIVALVYSTEIIQRNVPIMSFIGCVSRIIIKKQYKML